MPEGTSREPHINRYTRPEQEQLDVHVNDHGIVEVSEELFDQMLLQTGWTRAD